MKKMTFALACASTAALFADLPNTIGFEGYTNLPFTGLSLKGDDGGEVAVSASKWLASGTADNSAVKAYGVGDNLTAPTTGDGAGNNYLELSTEGDTLWRSINGLTAGEEPTLGAAQAIPDDKVIQIDTMVQFTATEDGAEPQTDSADKLAIWLNVDSTGATNLMVKASQLYTEGEGEGQHSLSTNAVYVLSNPEVVIQSGEWHQLTVKTIRNVLNVPSTLGSQEYASAFEVSVDGKVMAVTGEKVATDDFIAFYSENPAASMPDCFAAGAAAALQAGTLIPSMKGYTEYVDMSALQAVGFKGSGAIDNLSITAEDFNPAPADTIPFTITAASDVTVKWSTDGEEWTDYAADAQAPAGTIYVQLTKADGGVKVVEQTVVKGETNSFDLSSETFGWAEYLGEAIAENTYGIDNAAELKVLAAKAEALGTVGITFKQTENITWTAEDGAFAGIGVYNDANKTFKGTYDGDNHFIKNIVLSPAKYGGVFQQVTGGTIKNLTVDTVTFNGEMSYAVAPGVASNGKTYGVFGTEVGGAMVIGCIDGGTVSNVTSKGSFGSAEAPMTGSAGGIVCRTKGTVIVDSCVNQADLYGAAAKIAGIVVITQAGTLTIKDCSNSGAITYVEKGMNTPVEGAWLIDDKGGYAGILAYTNQGATIKDCSNSGTISAVPTGCAVGQILAGLRGGTVTTSGCTGTADQLANTVGPVDGLNFATVEGEVATLVADSVAANGANLKVMSPNATVTLANVDDSITLDTTLATATVTTTATDAYVAQAGNVYTVTAKADAEFTVSIDPTEAEWTDTLTLPTPTITGTTATGTWSPDATIVEPEAGTTNVYTYTVTVAATEMTKETTKSVEFKVYKNATPTDTYPEYIPDNAEIKGKFNTWVTEKANGDRDAASANLDAFLLNVAPSAVDEAKAAFKIVSIEQDKNGAWIAKVTNDEKGDGDAFGNGYVVIKGAATVDGAYNLAADAATAKFFKAFLVLEAPKAE